MTPPKDPGQEIADMLNNRIPMHAWMALGQGIAAVGMVLYGAAYGAFWIARESLPYVTPVLQHGMFWRLAL